MTLHESEYWDDVGRDWKENRPDSLWRAHSDAINTALIEKWLPAALVEGATERVQKRHAEIAILITGRHWKAEYEFYAHAELARKAGVEEHIIKALAAGRRPEFSSAEDATVYDLCTEMLSTRRVSDAIYKRALDTFGMQTLVELIAIMGYYCMVSITLNAFEAPLPTGEGSPFPD